MARPGEEAPFALTRSLAERVAGFDPAALSDAAAERAGIAILDTLGVMFAGRDEPAVRALVQMLKASGAMAETPQTRALVFGTAAHALDYDDVAFGGHVSAVIVPAILALLPPAGQGHAIPGRRVLAAYAMGLEAWAEVSTRERTLYHAKGGHPTGLLGPIGAAAAASVILGLDAERTRNAIATAASIGAGLTVSFGSMTKPFHAGRAAEAGVTAALLAQAGFTGAPDALEAPNGFLAVQSPKGEIDLARPLLMDEGGLRLDHIAPSVKRYPVCYSAHRAVDAAIELHPDYQRLAPDVARIEVLLSPRHSQTLRYRAPETVPEARFSTEYSVAAALLTGGLGLGDLSEAGLDRPAVRAVMAKVVRVLSDRADPVLDGYAAWDQVTLVLEDGRRIQSPEIMRPLGHADRPMTAKAAQAKARDCLAAAGLAPERGASLIEAATRLGEAAPDVSHDGLRIGLQDVLAPERR